MTRGFLLIFLGALATGCAAGQVGTVIIPTITVLATNTISPSATTTPEASNTPQPTHTPTATPLSHIDVPGWLSDPDVNVLMIITELEKGQFHLTFYNAATGEKFLPIFNVDPGVYFWMPNGSAFGILTRDGKYIYLVDSESGEI
ncbi:MAG: hypothetical protein IH859_01175 [Chloroflexi bacterium]|nr:hypothetical protein [Chloroflexota bacterium]